MNKDVIYIEPEDDITDIITKIENSKEKILALVPPKKSGVFRSIVNIKLIAKAGLNAGKTIVLVTTDPAIIKLAAATKLPVTKNLQSAPAIPKIDELADIETASVEEVVAESEKPNAKVVAATEDEAETTKDESDEAAKKDTDKSAKPSKAEKEAAVAESDDAATVEKDTKKPADKKKPKMGAKKRNILIGVGIGAFAILCLVGFWAFAIAPAVTVTVAIRTATDNFSQNATFTTKITEENASEGKFYLDEKKSETKIEASFDATGTKDVGEKATGEVVVYQYFRQKGNIAIEKGATFTNSGLTFVASEGAVLSWDGNGADECINNNKPEELVLSGCLISGRVKVVAAEPGAQYNISAAQSGWSMTANVSGVYSDSAMSGGTSKTVTIVTQADIDAALAKVVENNASSQANRKNKLLEQVEEGAFIIDSSYKQTISDPVSSPAVGEEVKANEKPSLTVTVTDTIYVVDKTKVEEFITEKAKLADSYKIYKMNDPFIENFTEVGETYVGKIKTSYVSGPRITENDVIETIAGKGIGEARTDLIAKFSGIDSNNTKIEASYPWVFSVPSDNTKITVKIDVEE